MGWGTRVAGRVARATVYRSGRIRRVPFGIGSGIRLEVAVDAPLHKYIGTAEIELKEHLKALATPGSRCFDVGSYDGHVAMILAKLTGSDVVCFESDAARIAQMEANLALNPGLAKHIRSINTYVAHETTESPRTDALDDLIADGQVFVPDFVKIDAEGAEGQILTGAAKLLRSRHPHLIIETHSEEHTVLCMTLLAAAGYSPKTVPQRDRLRENRPPDNEWIVAPGTSRDVSPTTRRWISTPRARERRFDYKQS
jgi:Methyltransferase FkbM domain